MTNDVEWCYSIHNRLFMLQEVKMIDRNSNVHLYQQVTDFIEQGIEKGTYVEGKKLPSERELSTRFGVDRITVRKAMDILSEKGLIDRIAGSGTFVKGDSATEVLEAAAAADFNDWHYIAFIMPDDSNFEARISSPFHSEMLRVIERECNKNKYHLVFKTLNADTTLQQLAETKGIAGLVFSSFVNENNLQAAKAHGIPSVVVNYISKEITSVSIDNASGAYEATKHLLKLGHRRIAVIAGSASYQSCKERLLGYRSAIEEFGLDFDSQIIVHGNWQHADGYKCAQELMDKYKNDMPTGLFVMNDAMAFGAIEALTKKGLVVPKDISVVGFDGTKNDYFHVPKLTTVKVNIQTIGKVAMLYLINSIDCKNQPVKIIVPADLVIGDTTTRPRIVG